VEATEVHKTQNWARSGKRLRTTALDRMATVIGSIIQCFVSVYLHMVERQRLYVYLPIISILLYRRNSNCINNQLGIFQGKKPLVISRRRREGTIKKDFKHRMWLDEVGLDMYRWRVLVNTQRNFGFLKFCAYQQLSLSTAEEKNTYQHRVP
jgi:hypothetical protein